MGTTRSEDLRKEWRTLITSTTALNKLKWGNDRFNAGITDGSNQPYITTDIPGVNVTNSNPTLFNDGEGLPAKTGIDFLLRNGFRAPVDAATDVSRLFKMFTDTRSPNGILFTAAQNLLSRTAVKTEATFGVGYGGITPPNFITGEGGGPVNEGIYLPSSTLAQAGVGFLGTHLNLMGLDPTSPAMGVPQGGPKPGAGLNTYFGVVNRNNLLATAVGEQFSNRLVNLEEKKQSIKSTDPNVISYKGGPGSILGIGSTNIRFALGARTGRNNTKLSSADGKSFFGEGDNPNNYNIFPLTRIPDPKTYTVAGKNKLFTVGATSMFAKAFSFEVDDLYQGLTWTSGSSDNEDGGLRSFQTSVYSPKPGDNLVSVGRSGNGRQWDQNTWTWTQQQIEDQAKTLDKEVYATKIIDFRKKIIQKDTDSEIKSSSVLSLAPDYNSKSANRRINRGDPGNLNTIPDLGTDFKTKDVFNYGLPANDPNLMPALDKLTAMPMYIAPAANESYAIQDFVKFRIAVMNNEPDGGGKSTFIHFRAFIDAFSDTYAASWNPVRYVGRGEDLYNYGGFGRDINMSFTVVAQSKAELIPMYKKLNYLASSLAPDYNNAGFMRGNIVKLTMGGYLHEQPGFITSLNYTIPLETSWEIAIDQEGLIDESVKELPHMIRVTGMAFTPIHTFLPRIAANANNPDERFIALSNNSGRGNYADEYAMQIPNGDGTNEGI
tara:strand:- start:4219 stop:6369 length:2151 start_codon:yes stop_codon:yes gene_type:complete